MSRRVSWRWLAGVLIVVLGGSVGLFFLHTRQFQRHIAALRTDIDRAEKEGDQERLQRLLERSLVLAPDGDSRARYGLLLARRARSPADSRRAAAVLSRVRPAQLRDYRSRYPEVRRTCVQLQITLGDHAAAKRDIERYLDEHKGEPDSSIGELEALKGECSAALGDNSAAEQSFTRAIAHAPARVESWVKLAELYQGALQRPAKAEKVMNDLVAANKRLPAPWLARARFRLGRRQMALAEADAKQARTLAPEDPGVLAVCGEIAAKRGRLDEARADLERALMRDSNRPALYVLLARVHQQAKRPADAIAMLKRGVERVAESERVLLQLELIDVAVALGELAEAEKTIARLRRNGSSPLLRLYEARLRLQQGQYRQAAELLEADRKVWAQATQFGARACAVLGECYAKLGNIDRHLEAHRLAVGMDAHSAPARLALASSLLDLGNYSEAITQLRQLVQDPDAAGTYTDPDGPERARRLLARAMVLHNLTLPPRARSWREVEEILAKAPAAQTILLRAEVLMAQGQAEGAGLLLAAARDANPGSPDLWAAAADWLDRQGQPECALALLAAGRDRLGDGSVLSSAALRLLARCPQLASDDDLAAEEKIVALLLSKPEADPARLTGALASVYLARGKLSEAVRLWTALAARQPSNLSVRLVLFDSAVASDQKAAARWLAEIKRIEGDEGTWWRCSEASLELARARQGDKSGLDRAIERLEEVARRRPGWLRLLVLEAQIQDLRGRHDEALEKYARAVKEGERQPAVVARLAVLLAERGRFSEVDQLLQQTQATQGTDAFLGVAAQAALSIGDSQRALELAERGAESRPDDPNSHVWLGLTLWAAGQPRDAEAELRQAARQGPDNPETWVALVSFLAGAGQSTQAESILEEAQGKLPTHLVAATAGRCWEVLGRADRAEQAYQKSAGLPGGTRRLAAFYLRRGEGAKAAPHLERLIGSRSEDAPWARRNLATLLAMRGDHSSFLRGIELLDENRSAGQPESIADTRVRVRLLATRSSGRRRSITLLENLAQARSAAPEDLFLLVQLLESRGDIREADKRMATLLEGGGDQRLYLAHAARSAFRRKDVPKARWWTDQLEQRYAGSWEAIEMTARVLHSEGNAEEAVARVAKAVADHREWAVLAGGLFEELNLIGPAARMYRRDASFAQPETVLRFALFLGRQGRVREALDLCGDVQESGSVEAAARVSVAVLRLGAKALDQTDRAAQIGRVEAWLDQALASKPAPALLLAQVDLFDLLERFDDAEKSYRRLLKMDPDNVTALNNLAFLLARRGKAAEALPLVERAIKVGGPESSLLDTRGMVRLAAGQAEESARDFTAAIEQQPAASFYLHLALARQGKARQSALKEAQTRGLTPESLHPLEKPLYRELIATAKGRADSGSRFRK